MSTTKLGSVDEILDFAIAREAEAVTFYAGLASRMTNPAMRKAFEDFSREESGHQAKLQAVKANRRLLPAQGKVLDLQLADYLVAGDDHPDMDYGAALVIAMKREKAAFRLYSDLAQTTDDEGLRETFLGLAQEEAKHKLRFELEYDEHVLTEN
jgi:rubrerythrin